MKRLFFMLSVLFLVQNSAYSQTGWFIQPSFTSMNLYDCKLTGSSQRYLGSDNGTVFQSTNNGYNWTIYDFHDPLLNGSSIKYILGQSNANFSAVGEGAAFAYLFAPIDSVMRIASPQTNLEAFSAFQGYFSYSAGVAAGEGGNFYIRDNSNGFIWRKDLAATALANGRNINYSWGDFFVGDGGLIMKADSIGVPLPNGERIAWRIIPSGTTKDLNCIVVGSGSPRGVAVGKDGTIIKTTDYGLHWTNVSSPVTSDLNAVWLGFGNLICGTNGTILRCYDSNMDKWYKQITPTTEDLFFIMTLANFEYISGGRNGIFLRTTDGGGALKRFIGTSIIEGFYNPTTNTMIGDTISVKIRASVSPYNLIASGKEKLSTSGYGIITIGPTAQNSVPYFVQINHRNSIETWSKTAPVFSNNDMYYDFYNAASKAYGDNQKQVDTSPVRFAFYSGDVNQDGNIDAIDLSTVDNDALNFVSGYVVSDVTGDNNVDANDLSKVDNNAFNFVSKITPP